MNRQAKTVVSEKKTFPALENRVLSLMQFSVLGNKKKGIIVQGKVPELQLRSN